MFKIKGSRKGLISEQEQKVVGSEKRLELASNDDLINREELDGVRYTQQRGSRLEQGSNMALGKSSTRMVRNRSVRPGSGIVPKAITKLSNGLVPDISTTNNNNNNKNPRQLATSNSHLPSGGTLLVPNRPSTSSNPNRSLALHKSKLLNRKGTAVMKKQGLQVERENEENGEESHQYISNQQMQQMISETMDSSGQCQQLRERCQEVYEQVRQKLLSNSSIMVLKWYKIVQDRLYNQVLVMNGEKAGEGNITCSNNSNNNSNNSSNTFIPRTISQLITLQLSRHLNRHTGLVSIQEKCSSQQHRLSSLIDQRLSKLESYLNPQVVL